MLTHTNGQDHVFVISESEDHGMQVFDLKKLRDLKRPTGSDINQLEADALYQEFGSCHNIVINEESGYAYAVGTKTCRYAPPRPYCSSYHP